MDNYNQPPFHQIPGGSDLKTKSHRKSNPISWRRVLYAGLLILTAGISALFGAFAGSLAVFNAVQSPGESQAIVQPSPVAENVFQVTSSDIETNITQTVDQVGGSVVTVISKIPGSRQFTGQTPFAVSSGSGVIVSADGYILTNNHVVEGAEEVTVILADGTALPAEIQGTDKYIDLAVLKVNGEVPTSAVLGDSDQLRRGETVIAIGSPLGDFTNSVTVGVVSATGRDLDTGNGFSLEGLVQTDAAINQGNSGGPLLNLAGEVVGINTLVVREPGTGITAEGLGFAVPSNLVRSIAEQIIDQGFSTRPLLGISWQMVSSRDADRFNLPVDSGAFVTQVAEDTPADTVGLQQGDIITHIGGIALDAEHPFINTLFNFPPGEDINLRVARGDQILVLNVMLGARNG